MRYVPGRVPKDPALPGMEPGERGQVYREMARVLAAIHTVDVERAGLTDFGKHGTHYSGAPLLWTPWGHGEVSCLERCPHFRD